MLEAGPSPLPEALINSLTHIPKNAIEPRPSAIHNILHDIPQAMPWRKVSSMNQDLKTYMNHTFNLPKEPTLLQYRSSIKYQMTRSMILPN